MNWRMLDLNLLVVFDAVGHERNVTRAAARLNMTQPAISHALGRLRSALHDDLFVRTPEGMEPTPHAAHLMQPVRAALENLHNALDGAAPFDPGTAERDFTIAVDNRTAVVFAIACCDDGAGGAVRPPAHASKWHARSCGTAGSRRVGSGAWWSCRTSRESF